MDFLFFKSVQLNFTIGQQKILKELQKRSQYVNLNYVYTSLLNDIKKFKQ